MFAKGCFDDQPQLTSLPDLPGKLEACPENMVCSEGVRVDTLRQANCVPCGSDRHLPFELTDRGTSHSTSVSI